VRKVRGVEASAGVLLFKLLFMHICWIPLYGCNSFFVASFRQTNLFAVVAAILAILAILAGLLWLLFISGFMTFGPSGALVSRIVITLRWTAPSIAINQSSGPL